MIRIYMSQHKDHFKIMVELEEAETPYVLASVFMVNGSSSGKVGDKALYDENGRRIIGYIGGGCIENRVAATAKESLQDGEPKIVNVDLDSDQMEMGIPCGGYMSVIVEPKTKVPTLLVRGMGSVVEALSQIAHLLKIKVIIQTPENEVDRFPNADQIITDPLDLEEINESIDFFILAAHHRDDHKQTLAALEAGIPFVAVVASKKKANIILEYLKENDVKDKDLKRFHSPAGLDLNAKSPEEIALSIMSEIVMLHNGGTGMKMSI